MRHGPIVEAFRCADCSAHIYLNSVENNAPHAVKIVWNFCLFISSKNNCSNQIEYDYTR